MNGRFVTFALYTPGAVPGPRFPIEGAPEPDLWICQYCHSTIFVEVNGEDAYSGDLPSVRVGLYGVENRSGDAGKEYKGTA